jgi:hypothetical protein
MAASTYVTGFASPPTPHKLTRFYIEFNDNVASDTTVNVSDFDGNQSPGVVLGAFPEGRSFVVASGTSYGSVAWIPNHSGPNYFRHYVVANGLVNVTPDVGDQPQIGQGLSSPVWFQ